MVLPEALNLLIYVIIIVIIIVVVVWLLQRVLFFIVLAYAQSQGEAPPVTVNPMQYADKYRSDYTFPFYVALIGFSSMF